MMARLTGDAARPVPYQPFGFRVSWGTGDYVAGVSRVSALLPTTVPVEHRAGTNPGSSQSPGLTKYEPITMQHGITHDLEFAQWANGVSRSGPDFRRDLTIDVFDEAGRKMISYKVYAAWVRELTARPDPDANANALLIESITIEHEGCEVETGA